MPKPRPQRVRDPVHNLIEFGSDQFEHTLWRLIQTRPFQRLRRIRQLGFSEFVFPGATHTRFAHSVGVFHTARQLMSVIHGFIASHDQQFKAQQAQYALTAALLHDVGHGMFSHAFEAVGKTFEWPMAKHEDVSQRLIREGEIAALLDEEFGSGYAGNVADIIAHGVPSNLYDSVVSSQFDADRLDYMQRDRLMTGVQSSGVDPTWLLANLEVAEVALGADEAAAGTIETLVLGPKAFQTAESYVLALFHLYPNVYLHKTTRGAEKIFQALITRIVWLHREGHIDHIGLPERHPIIRFVASPDNLDRALDLDDTVFWGALPMLVDANDEHVSRLAVSLRERAMMRCVDIKRRVEQEITFARFPDRKERRARVSLICDDVVKALTAEDVGQPERPSRFLIDKYGRNPYKRFQDSKSPLNQILIRAGDGPPTDMAEFSPLIANAEPFDLARAYVFRDDSGAIEMIENIVRTKIQEGQS